MLRNLKIKLIILFCFLFLFLLLKHKLFFLQISKRNGFCIVLNYIKFIYTLTFLDNFMLNILQFKKLKLSKFYLEF